MTSKNLTQLFDALQNNDEFRKDFVQLALRHGVDFTAEDDQLSDEELASVSGGNMEIQHAWQKQQRTLQMMSNISKMLHDTSKAMIQNMKA